MTKMLVNHSRVAVDLEKILQCGSVESKTALFFSACEKIFFGRVKMTFGQADVRYSFPDGQAAGLTFFSPRTMSDCPAGGLVNFNIS